MAFCNNLIGRHSPGDVFFIRDMNEFTDIPESVVRMQFGEEYPLKYDPK